MTSHWRLAARAAIQKAILSVVGDWNKLLTVDKDDLLKIKKSIDAAYPFGMREYYPYKIWLEERRYYFYELGILHKLPDKRGRRTRKPGVKHDFVSPGQLSLF